MTAQAVVIVNSVAVREREGFQRFYYLHEHLLPVVPTDELERLVTLGAVEYRDLPEVEKPSVDKPKSRRDS